MKKFFKYLIIGLGSLLVILVIGLQVFLYKVEYGFPKNQTEKHNIQIPKDQKTILLFSKTTGFRHGAAIRASKPIFAEMAQENNWYLYETEDAGIFNEEQLERFDVVIWNNCSGRVLTDAQRKLFQDFITNGGTYIGLHASGDLSHHWDWYKQELIGAEFSHHPIIKHIQKAEMVINSSVDSILRSGLPERFDHDEEWYVFYDTPEKKNFEVLYRIDGRTIDPNGNLLFERSKDFGMGENHPVAWYKRVGKGKSYYTSLGHLAEAFESEPFVNMLENSIEWGLN